MGWIAEGLSLNSQPESCAGRGSAGLCRRLDPGTAFILAAGVSPAALVGRTSVERLAAAATKSPTAGKEGPWPVLRFLLRAGPRDESRSQNPARDTGERTVR